MKARVFIAYRYSSITMPLYQANIYCLYADDDTMYDGNHSLDAGFLMDTGHRPQIPCSPFQIPERGGDRPPRPL